MIPVLFLDFDGPLFPERLIPHSRPISEYPGSLGLHPYVSYWEMDKVSVSMLNTLYATYQFDTVVSSTWKEFHDREQIVELFEANNLNLHLHKDWKISNNGRMSASRVHEIRWWLDEHKVGDRYISHIILDDPYSGASLLGDNWEKLGLQKPFIIDQDVGIDSKTFVEMREVVGEWLYNPDSRISWK